MNLRIHQKRLQSIMTDVQPGDMPLDILADVIPGGGKSMLPGLICQKFPKLRLAWFVPRLSLARQAAVGMQRDFGIQIRESGNDTNPSRGTRGFVTTHNALTTQPDLWLHELSRYPYILVIDEAHHAQQTRSGEFNALASAISKLPYHVRLLMTGTLETNDNSLIYGVPYSSTPKGYELDVQSFGGKLIRYSRSEALGENAIVPVETHNHNGPVKWENITGIHEARLSEVDRKDEAQAIWTALKTDLADQLLANCVIHWKEFGDKLLVVTADQQTAKKYHEKLRKEGISSGLAISDADDAQKEIEHFREGGLRCLVTCQMAYEGLDVPSITHIACLTHIRSSPWITQMFARAWRAAPGKTKCWVFVPDDPRMNRVIDHIRSEQESIVPLLINGSSNNGLGGRSSIAAFVPISGEVLSVTAGMLDGDLADDPISSQVAAICRQHNLSPDHPMAAQFIGALRAGGHGQGREKTVTDQMVSIRNQIASACRSADNAKGVNWGAHQTLLYNAMGRRRLENMTLKELEYARTVCTRICS